MKKHRALWVILIVVVVLAAAAAGVWYWLSSRTAQVYGAKDYARVKRSVANGILLAAIVIIVMTTLSVSTMQTLLRLMNTPANIFEDAHTYISIICMGIVASVYYNLFSAFLQAVGNSKVPLCFLVFSACLNVVLDLQQLFF